MALVCPDCVKRVTKDDYLPPEKGQSRPRFKCLNCGSTGTPKEVDDARLKEREESRKRFYIKLGAAVAALTLILMAIFPPDALSVFVIEEYLMFAVFVLAWLYAVLGMLSWLMVVILTRATRITFEEIDKRGLYFYFNPMILPSLLISSFVFFSGYGMMWVFGALLVGLQITFWANDYLKTRAKRAGTAGKAA